MSDHIGHLGICDDTFRLAILHPAIHPTLKLVISEHRADAHMGSVTRGADNWSVDLVAWAGSEVKRPDGQRDPLVLRKLAFVLGSLTHRAADRLTKPITNCWPRGSAHHGPDDEANESKIMQDIFVFKEVFGSGIGQGADPFTAAALAPTATEGEAKLEEYFRVLLRRALIAMHTIAPDSQNIHPWLTAFLQRMQTFPKSLEQYAALAARWDPAKVKKYLTDKHFYCRDDALIRLARNIQRGSTVTADQLAAAHAATDRTNSRYARALARALDYLLAAGELFDGRLAPADAATRFDIGVPELALQD